MLIFFLCSKKKCGKSNVMRLLKGLVVFWLILSGGLFAQSNNILKPNGEIVSFDEPTLNDRNLPLQKRKPVDNTNLSTPDTLKYDLDRNALFGLLGKDVIVQWFKTPADLTLKSVGINFTPASEEEISFELKLVKLKLDEEEIINHSLPSQLGYYQSPTTLNGIAPFEGDSTSGWIGLDQDSTFIEAEIWNKGETYQIDPDSSTEYQWIKFSEDILLPSKEIFGIAVRNLNSHLDTNWVRIYAEKNFGMPGFKFYQNGRNVENPGETDSTSWGWWLVNYTFDMAAGIEIPDECIPIFIEITDLNTTISTAPREVTANYKSCAPIEKALLKYSTDGENFESEQMEIVEEGIHQRNYKFKANIPGFPGGTEVTYFVEVINVEGSSDKSLERVYQIFEPSPGINTLLLFNGFDEAEGFPQSYYFGKDDFENYTTLDFPHDTLASVELTEVLLNNYDNLIEIAASNDIHYNDKAVRKWLEQDDDHNYFLAGQEWLGWKSGFEDSTYEEGDFEYDILGITRSYNDISYHGASGNKKPSLVFPRQDSRLGDSLSILFHQEENITDSMRYDPMGEINQDNWLDGFEVREGVEIDLTAESRAIEGEPAVKELNIAVHHELNGNKIVFLAYDPLSLNSAPRYYWYGFSSTAPQVQTLDWFGIPRVTSVEGRKNELPNKFKLFQNYPNPFNPVTTIRYSIPVNPTSRSLAANIKLEIFNILGEKVATPVNKKQQPGVYEVRFDGSGLSSGVYFYRLKIGEFSKMRKMQILK
jgi:hypothetical protein